MLKYLVSFCWTFTVLPTTGARLMLKKSVIFFCTRILVMLPLGSGMATWLSDGSMCLPWQVTNTLAIPATAGVNDTTCCSMENTAPAAPLSVKQLVRGHEGAHRRLAHNPVGTVLAEGRVIPELQYVKPNHIHRYAR